MEVDSMWLKWFPWRMVIQSAARRYGFLDPLVLAARLKNFAQPSEVAAPLELLRAGAVFHARGLINSQAIQHNLDWIWPYWVERQFDPLDDSFIPRAFSVTLVNLTHRNWTAVGLPDTHNWPIVDPRGLVTPLYARVGRKLIESIRHETTVHDNSALRVFSVKPMPIREAMERTIGH